MALVTFDGHIGAGAPEVGRRIARMFDLQYVDRLILPRAAEIGRDAAAGAARTRRKFSDRFWSVMERAISGFALGNAAGDPYFTVPEPLLLPLTWDESPDAPRAAVDPASSADCGALSQTLDHITRAGRAVLVHRAGCVELRQSQAALRVGVFASWEDRVERVMRREGLVRRADAEKVIADRERAQRAYFKTIHNADPDDSDLYDICLDTSAGNVDMASLKVARQVRARFSGMLAVG